MKLLCALRTLGHILNNVFDCVYKRVSHSTALQDRLEQDKTIKPDDPKKPSKYVIYTSKVRYVGGGYEAATTGEGEGVAKGPRRFDGDTSSTPTVIAKTIEYPSMTYCFGLIWAIF